METSKNYGDLLEKGMRKKKKKDVPVVSGRARSLSEDKPNAGKDLEAMLKPERKKKGRS